MTTLHSTSPLNLPIFHPILYNPSEASIAKREIEFKKYAPKFNMQVCTFTQFLKLFKIATNGYRISKDCYKITLFQSLLGSAAALAQGCSPLEEPYCQMGPDKYVSKLKKIFEPDTYKHALWNQYNGRVQQLKEPTVAYLQAKYDMYRLLHEEETVLPGKWHMFYHDAVAGIHNDIV